MQGIVSFVELGALILAWVIVWNFVIKGFTGLHRDNPAASGLAAVFVA